MYTLVLVMTYSFLENIHHYFEMKNAKMQLAAHDPKHHKYFKWLHFAIYYVNAASAVLSPVEAHKQSTSFTMSFVVLSFSNEG